MQKYPFKQNPAIVDDIIEELSENPHLKRFFLEHDLSHDTIETYLNELMTFNNEQPKCIDCPGLDECKQDVTGYQPVLEYINDRVSLSYQPCNYLQHYEAQQTVSNRIQAMYMPKMVLEARLDDFHMKTEHRKTIYKAIMHIMTKIKIGEHPKGMFLSGRYQIGKTYTLAAMANHFASIGKTVLIGYYPDMVREIKSSIRTGNLESIIESLKHVDVLMLDDIGGESPSHWLRDEVLGPILQHRLLDQKLTFFSSNIPLDELPKYMVENEQRAEKIKAHRIIERIKALTDEYTM
jgi:primosomal protein DnaI